MIESTKRLDQVIFSLAVQTNDAEKLESFLNENTAFIDETMLVDGVHMQAIHVAAKNGFLECLQVLIAHNCQLNLSIPMKNSKSKLDFSALDLAIQHDHVTSAVALLEANCDISPQSLYLAAKGGRCEVLNRMLKQRKSVNVVWGVKKTGRRKAYYPLIEAAREGHIDCVRVLIKAQADVNYSRWDTIPPLIAACREGHVEIMSLLIEAGANVEIEDDDGHTALLEAVLLNQPEAISVLAESGCNLDKHFRPCEGRSPLKHAVMSHLKECVITLIENGSSFMDENGESVFNAALEHGSEDVVCALMDFGCFSPFEAKLHRAHHIVRERFQYYAKVQMQVLESLCWFPHNTVEEILLLIFPSGYFSEYWASTLLGVDQKLKTTKRPFCTSQSDFGKIDFPFSHFRVVV